MSQYSGYQVQLHLKNGDKVKGLISQVIGKSIKLDDGKFANFILKNFLHNYMYTNRFIVTFVGSNSKGAKGSLVVEGSNIKDLVVLELPKSKKANGKKSKSSKQQLLPSSISTSDQQYSANTTGTTTPIQRGNSRSAVSSPKPNSAQLKKSKYQKRKDDQVDWEDSNNELPEFDFQGNLAKFDKNSVFAELSLTDSIDPSQRLVGHNKTSNISTPKAVVANEDKPKTNYDIHEMVKTESNWQENWDQIKVDDRNAIQRLTQQLNQEQSIRKEREQPSRVSTSTPTNALYTLVKDGDTEKLPLASPINLLEIERLSQDEFGFGASLLLETSGFGLCSLVLNIFGASQTSRLSNGSSTRFNVNSPPLVLILVGNNRTGAKALNAGRQLSNKGVRVISLLISDNTGDEELISIVSEQLTLFEKFGGKTIHALSQLKTLLKKIDSPLELIIDGLQGFDTNISDLMDVELSKAVSVIKWTNKQNCHKLSIDIPSGIDAGSGLLVDLEDNCFVESKFIVSMGLPLSAIIHAYGNGLISDGVHYLVDIGAPRKLYQKGSLRKFDKNWFGVESFVKLQLVLKNE